MSDMTYTTRRPPLAKGCPKCGQRAVVERELDNHNRTWFTLICSGCYHWIAVAPTYREARAVWNAAK